MVLHHFGFGLATAIPDSRHMGDLGDPCWSASASALHHGNDHDHDQQAVHQTCDAELELELMQNHAHSLYECSLSCQCHGLMEHTPGTAVWQACCKCHGLEHDGEGTVKMPMPAECQGQIGSNLAMPEPMQDGYSVTLDCHCQSSLAMPSLGHFHGNP